jgi:tellurite resistance-related uncharacterized protein
MTDLPEGLVAYRRTPVFDQATLPAGLRKSHRTKPGVWALIHVLQGRLRYRRLEPPSEQILSPGSPGVVLPQQAHEVEPLGEVQFYVEFYAAQPGAGSPHCAGEKS